MNEWNTYDKCCNETGYGNTDAYKAYRDSATKEYKELNEKINKITGEGWVKIFNYK